MVKNLVKNFIIILLVNCLGLIFYFGYADAAALNIVKNEQAEISLLGGEFSAERVKLGLNVNMQPGWHIYWRLAGDTGFPPVLDWSGSANIDNVEFLWPAPNRLRQELQPDNFAESYTYSGNVTFPINITAKDITKPIDILLHISYAICSETCIPGQADLSLNLQPDFKSLENLKLIENANKLVPQANGAYGLKIETVNKVLSQNGGKQFIEVTASNVIDFLKDATILVEGGQNLAFNNPTVKITGRTAKFTIPVTFLTEKTTFDDTDLIITLINGNDSVELKKNSNDLGISEEKVPFQFGGYSYLTLLLMVLFAFIGGIILNVMPCILPILSIKILGVIKHGGGAKSDVTASFLMTALGIVTAFTSLALITIWAKNTGELLGWGFHFQEPYFIITLVIILTLFAANLWGLLEIRLPAHLTSLSTKSEGMAGHFMSGILATILATPCTAPFLGTAVGFAITRGATEIIIIFIAMGIGLAFPYLLFSMFPGMIIKLPKPGAWMVKVKNLMGVLLALTAIWLIWVLSNQLGMFAAVTLLSLCLIKLIKLWFSQHIALIHKIRIPVLLIIILLAFILPIRVANKGMVTNLTANHKMWEEFQPENIQNLVASGKIVFVDITADWCLTCKVNKLVVLESDEIKNTFANMGVVAMQADWTNHDNHIAEYLIKYQRIGIPFNIVYGKGAPNGIVLSELLSKSEVLAALKKVSAD